MNEITISDFHKVSIHTGTVLTAHANIKARKPAYVLTVDFGQTLGIKTTSAQITDNYQPDQLIGRQVVAVTNFPALRIAGVKSEVLVLGAVDDDGAVVLLRPDYQVENGQPIA